MQELYTWGVTYSDGTTMHEYDNAEGRGFAEIGEKPVKSLEIQPQRDRVLAAYRMDIPDGATPVFFRRRFISLGPERLAPLIEVLAGNKAPNSELFEQVVASPTQTVHCIGWKCGEEALYRFVFENGSSLDSSDLQAV